MRAINEFIIWNHIFIAINVIYAFYNNEYILGFLGFFTCIFSIFRHIYNEQIFNIIEPFFAKACIGYMFIMSLYYFNYTQICLLIIIKLLFFFIYRIQYINYEYIHPWLHIIISLYTYLYLRFYI